MDIGYLSGHNVTVAFNLAEGVQVSVGHTVMDDSNSYGTTEGTTYSVQTIPLMDIAALPMTGFVFSF